MELNLHDQVAVVFGGAKGIGLAIGAAFAAEKSLVALVDLDRAVSDAAQGLHEQHGIESLGLPADVTDYSAVTQSVEHIVERWGRCDHVVYAAGMGSGKYGFPFWNLSPEDWGRVLDVNLLGAVHVAHAVAPPMSAARRGTLLFISSVAAQIGSQTDPPYSAAKAGLLNFMQCAAKDFAPYNVRVNAICPGMVMTALNEAVWRAWNDQQPANLRQNYEQWAEEKIRRVAPLGRWQQPGDIAALAVFLASPFAQDITGQTLNVDGGQVMHW